MDQYTITKCRICSKLMKRYSMQVYPGDSSCCSSCNKKVENGKETLGEAFERINHLTKLPTPTPTKEDE